MSRWLATKPSVLILDEPTQGVDVGAKAEIHALMVDLAEQGAAILMISSELPEVLGMSDRIGVMRGGRLAGVLERAAATPEGILALALGLGAVLVADFLLDGFKGRDGGGALVFKIGNAFSDGLLVHSGACP